jgi:hypothetical protein
LPTGFPAIPDSRINTLKILLYKYYAQPHTHARYL